MKLSPLERAALTLFALLVALIAWLLRYRSKHG